MNRNKKYFNSRVKKEFFDSTARKSTSLSINQLTSFYIEENTGKKEEKNNNNEVNEALSDGSGGAFEGTEMVRE